MFSKSVLRRKNIQGSLYGVSIVAEVLRGMSQNTCFVILLLLIREIIRRIALAKKEKALDYESRAGLHQPHLS